jgi:hypothetical protein
MTERYKKLHSILTVMYHKFGHELYKNPKYKIPQHDKDYVEELLKKMEEELEAAE